jgi:hypothetical protein
MDEVTTPQPQQDTVPNEPLFANDITSETSFSSSNLEVIGMETSTDGSETPAKL